MSTINPTHISNNYQHITNINLNYLNNFPPHIPNIQLNLNKFHNFNHIFYIHYPI